MFNKLLKFTFQGAIMLVVLFNLLFFSLTCQAGTQADLKDQMNTVGTKGWGSGITATNSFTAIIETLISALLGLLGVIFLILIIYAGYSWMMAQGDEEKVTKAKDTITRAIVGLIIIVAAYAITFFVFSNLPAGEGGGYITGSP
jgi:hypothetical protein